MLGLPSTATTATKEIVEGMLGMPHITPEISRAKEVMEGRRRRTTRRQQFGSTRQSSQEFDGAGYRGSEHSLNGLELLNYKLDSLAGQVDSCLETLTRLVTAYPEGRRRSSHMPLFGKADSRRRERCDAPFATRQWRLDPKTTRTNSSGTREKTNTDGFSAPNNRSSLKKQLETRRVETRTSTKSEVSDASSSGQFVAPTMSYQYFLPRPLGSNHSDDNGRRQVHSVSSTQQKDMSAINNAAEILRKKTQSPWTCSTTDLDLP
jgi:hypothetical protein